MKFSIGKTLTKTLACLAIMQCMPAQAVNDGHLGVYAGKSTSLPVTLDGSCPDMSLDTDGTDLDCLIEQIKYSNANVYYYTFSTTQRSQWIQFLPFMKALAIKAPDVKVFANFAAHQVARPFGYCPKDSTNCDEWDQAAGQWRVENSQELICDASGGLASDLQNCNMFGMEIWAKKLVELKTNNPEINLAGISMDDFDNNLDANGVNNLQASMGYNHPFWAPSELGNVKTTLNSPYGMELLATTYYKDVLLLHPSHMNQYLNVLNGINYPPLIHTGCTNWSVDDTTIDCFESEIQNIKNKIGSMKIYTMLYATHYNLSLDPSSAHYVDVMTDKALALTNGVTMYRLPTAYTEAQLDPRFDIPAKREQIRAKFADIRGLATVPGGPITQSYNGSVSGGQWQHYGPFTTGFGTNMIATMTGSGDADLYVKLGSQPSDYNYDCRPFSGTSAETCTVAGGGQMYVSVKGFSAATFDLQVDYNTGDTIVVPPPAPGDITDYVGKTLTAGQRVYHSYDVTPGSTFIAEMNTVSGHASYTLQYANYYSNGGYAIYHIDCNLAPGNTCVQQLPSGTTSVSIAVYPYQDTTYTGTIRYR